MNKIKNTVRKQAKLMFTIPNIELYLMLWRKTKFIWNSFYYPQIPGKTQEAVVNFPRIPFETASWSQLCQCRALTEVFRPLKALWLA